MFPNTIPNNHRTTISGAICGMEKTFPSSPSTICRFPSHPPAQAYRPFPHPQTPPHYRSTSSHDPRLLRPSHPRISNPRSSLINSPQGKGLHLRLNFPKLPVCVLQKPTSVLLHFTLLVLSRATALISATAPSHSPSMPHRRRPRKCRHSSTYQNITFRQIGYRSKSQAECGS